MCVGVRERERARAREQVRWRFVQRGISGSNAYGSAVMKPERSKGMPLQVACMVA
jgi:hypothetical protein